MKIITSNAPGPQDHHGKWKTVLIEPFERLILKNLVYELVIKRETYLTRHILVLLVRCDVKVPL